MTDLHASTTLQAAAERVPILMYHKIEDRFEIGINTFSPANLKTHLSFLRERGYQTITFRDLLQWPDLPEKSIIITFDDAYESVFRNALPLFREYKFVGVVFAVGGFLGKLNSWDANLGGIRFRHMTAAQLQQMEAQGWEIGAHTMTHRALTHLPLQEVKKELLQSRQVLTEATGHSPITFAYPFGRYNRDVQVEVARAGFRFACRGIHGRSNGHGLLSLQRIPVYQFDGKRSLGRKLNGRRMSRIEYAKLLLLSWPAGLTPVYQKLFKKDLTLE